MLKGSKMSEESKANLKKGWLKRKARGLGIPWNKGLKIKCNTGRTHFKKGEHFSPSTEFKKDNVPWIKGKKLGFVPKQAFKKGNSPWNKGKPFMEIRGKNHHNWKGGISSKQDKLKKSIEWKNWRKKIFKQDNYTCQGCDIRGGYLEPHHLFSKAKHPELCFEEWNGQTLCKDCHTHLHNELGRGIE